MSRTQVIWKNLRSRWNICVIGYSHPLSHFQDLLGTAHKILIFAHLGLLDLTFDEEFLTFINMWHSSVSVLLSHHHGCLYFPASDIMALSSSSAQTCLGVGVVVGVGWGGGGRVVLPPGAFAFVALIDHRAKLNHHHTARQPLSTEGLCHRHPYHHHHWPPCDIPILYFDLYALSVIVRRP